ncbi:MAG: DNA-processing protein DprA, partial [Gaiellaceae bacterium]
MTELATAVFAANTGAHLIDAPRSRRFELFRRGFDEAAFLRNLAERGLRWVARSDPNFPPRLRTIHDPPAGLFVRGAAPLALVDGPAVAIVGARACSAYGSEVAAQLARTLTQA